MINSGAECEDGEILSDTDSGELTSTEDVGFSLEIKDLEELSSVEEVFSSDSEEIGQKRGGKIEETKKKDKLVAKPKRVNKATVVDRPTAAASPRKCKRKRCDLPSSSKNQSLKSIVMKPSTKRVPVCPPVGRSVHEIKTRARPRKNSYVKGKNIVEELVSAVSQSHQCLPNSGARNTGADLRKRLLKLGMVKNSGSVNESTDVLKVDLCESVAAVPDNDNMLTDTAHKVESNAGLVLPVDVKGTSSSVLEEPQVNLPSGDMMLNAVKSCDSSEFESKVSDEIVTVGEIQSLTIDVDSTDSAADEEDIETLRAMALRSNLGREKGAADTVVIQDGDEELWLLRINALRSAMLRKCAARKKAKDLAAKLQEIRECNLTPKASSSEVDRLPSDQDTLTEPIDMDLAESDEDSEIYTIECENQDLFYALYADDAANYIPEAWAPLDKQDEDMKNDLSDVFGEYVSPDSSGLGLFDDPSSYAPAQPFPALHSDQMFSTSVQHLASSCVVVADTVSSHGDATSRKNSAQRTNLNAQRPNLIQVPITARPETVVDKSHVEQQQQSDLSTNATPLVVRKEIGDRCYLGTPPLGWMDKTTLVNVQSVGNEQPSKKKLKKPISMITIPTNTSQAIVLPRHTSYLKKRTVFARSTVAPKGKLNSSSVDSNFPRFVIPLMARDSDSDDEILPERPLPPIRTITNDTTQTVPSLSVTAPVSSYQKDSQFDRKVEAFLKSTRKKHDNQRALTDQAGVASISTVPCTPTMLRSLTSSTATSSTTVLPKPKSVPSTSVPSKSVPSKSVPSKSVPSNSVPSKSVPSNSVPSKSVPSNSVPSKSVPSKSVPSKSVLSKSVPLKSVPSKSVLSTSVPSKPGPQLGPVMTTGTVSPAINQSLAKDLSTTPLSHPVALKRAATQAPPLLIKGMDNPLATCTASGTLAVCSVPETPVPSPVSITPMVACKKMDLLEATLKKPRIAAPKCPLEPIIAARCSQSASPVPSLFLHGVASPIAVPALETVTVAGTPSIEEGPREQMMSSQTTAAASVDASVRANLQQARTRVGAPLVCSFVAQTAPERVTFASHVKKIGVEVSQVRDAQLVINYQHRRIAESKRAIEKATRDIKRAKEIIDRKREVVVDQWGELQPRLGVLKLRSRVLSALDSYNIHEAKAKCDRAPKLNVNHNLENCNEVLNNAEELMCLLTEDLEASKENGIEWPVVCSDELPSFVGALDTFEPELVAVDIMCPYGASGNCIDEGCLFAHL